MDYVDGCVLAVPTKNKTAYIEHATKAAKLFKNTAPPALWNAGVRMCPKGS